jgi:flagellar hook-associated protein 1
MGSLSIALRNAASSQRAFDRALQTIQNNVSNVYTPGYARQRPTFRNAPFNPEAGLPGGIRPGVLQDTRSRYAEGAVRDQQGRLSYDQQLQADLSRVEKAFDINSQYAIPAALSSFFNSFSQLSVNPNDKLLRQAVIDQSSAVSQSFRVTATAISQASAQADAQIKDSVTSINERIEQLQQINKQRRLSPNSSQDAGLDAEVYAALEEISQYASVQPIFQPDGTVSVYLSGRTPLLVGETQWKISQDPSNTSTLIRDNENRDITSQITDGKLGAVLQERNKILPGYASDLNTLAKTLADQVNQQQRDGLTPAGTPPTGDIFVYDSTLGEAASLASSGLGPDDIAAALPSAPGGNGNALNFADLAKAKTVNGLSFSEYFGTIGESFGRDLSSARTNAKTGELLLAQSRNYRQELSGVNLDEAAAELIQFQRAYQASAELFRVLNQLTETTLGLLR